MNGTTRLCITRHGETDWNITGILQGWIDVPLNDNGRRQSYALAEALAGAGFTRICTSPLRRAAETAEIIAGVWGLPPPIPCEGLKERNFGLIQGMPKQRLAVSHPGLHEEILRRNPACPFDQGESLDHFADRIIAALDDMAQTQRGQTVLVITHGWVMDVITRHVRNLPRDTLLEMKRKNGESLWLVPTRGSRLIEVGPPEPHDRTI